jgi:hypothetical protein
MKTTNESRYVKIEPGQVWKNSKHECFEIGSWNFFRGQVYWELYSIETNKKLQICGKLINDNFSLVSLS